MRPNPIGRSAAAALAAVLLFPLAGCANDAASTSHNGAAPAGRKVDGPKVKIMVGGLDKVIYLPAMLTQRLGYFADAGVNVELMSEPAGVNATTALLAGDVQGAVGFYDHTIDLQAKGKNVESVVQFSQAPGEVEIVSAKQADAIRSGADFKGRKLGVTSVGSSTDFLTKYLAVKNGTAVSEFSPIAVGAGQTFIAALQQGSIDAGMTTDPTVATILDKGLGRILYDMRTPEGSREALGGLYPSSSLYMNTEWVGKNKDTTQRLADAFVRTLTWMSTHSPQEIAAAMPADYAQGGAEQYAAAIKATLPMFTTDGVMPADGPRTVLAVLAAFHPDVRGKEGSIDLARTYTTEFVAKAAAKG
ncbi:ABC transporter substrate-binding protein [Kitasatospora sp. NPDC048239]|uniref:ABC transporter substrate-binding protein n=1 Tax=Kitasatospora sp. NPDC048239 TaxID=3364046 RepID=UPI003723904D